MKRRRELKKKRDLKLIIHGVYHLTLPEVIELLNELEKLKLKKDLKRTA